MELTTVAIYVATGAISIISVQVARRRLKRDMQKYASANQFEVLNKGLPEGFLLRGTSLREAEMTDVMRGKFRGSDIVIFNATFTETRGRRVILHVQTVVAFPNDAHLGSRQVDPSTGHPDLYFEVAGDWFLLYRRNTVIGSDKLNEWCGAMHTVTQTILSRVVV